MRAACLFGCLLLLLPMTVAKAQIRPADSVGVDSLPAHRLVWRFGGGTGLLLPVNLPAAIFRQPGLTLQLGLTHEYYWRRRISLLTGFDYRLQQVVADARFAPTSPADGTGQFITVQPAPDSVKYASLRYQLVSMSVMVRCYFARNAVKRLFVDLGASVNFPVSAIHQYRANGLNRRLHLTSFTRQPIILIEMAAGANGRVFGGRLTKVNSLLGALLFGGFVGFDFSVRTQPGRAVVTAGFLTKFIF